jgi:hypothetical protein
MVQANFAHESHAYVRGEAVGLALTAGIFAARAHLRAEMVEDAQGAGFRVRASGLDALAPDGAPLPDVVLVDCPEVDASIMAALCRLDLAAARSGAQIIVSTTLAGLDEVFACMDQSDPQILVNPRRAERVIALGRVLAGLPSGGVRELSEEDRIALLRLTEQVTQLADRIDRLSAPPATPGEGSAFRFASPDPEFRGADDEDGSERLLRATRPPLPDPRLVRRIIRQRQLRGRFLDAELFADPAWDMTSKISGKSIYFKAAT